MSIPTYTPKYPPDGSSLGQTKSVIRNNLDGTFQTLGIDHVNNNGKPGSQPACYHTIIHEFTQTNVSTVPGYSQIFSGVPGTLIINGVVTPNTSTSTDSQLFYLTAQGGPSQLTGNHAASNGYNWMGGILFQWGTFNSDGGPGQIVTLPIPFPRNFFAAQATMIRNSSNVDVIYSTTNATPGVVSTISFRDTSSGNPFFWFAIGN